MLSFGNATCAAQISAQPKSSLPFYEKLSTYVSLRVSVAIMPFLNLNFAKKFAKKISTENCLVSG
jgi:hypothetical protein